MQTCKNCGTVLDDDLRFCTECGTALRPLRYEPPTERMSVDPTLVIPPARVTDAPAPSAPAPPANTTQVVLKTAVATILLISFGALITWLVIRDSRDTGKITEMRTDASGNQSNTRNSNESSASNAPTPYGNTNMAANRNAAATAPTPYPAPTTPAQSAPTSRKLAYLNKSDVRLRDRDDIHATVIRDNLTYGTKLIVLGTSSKVDNIWVQSENRYVRSDWLYVQLEDYPSIKGWVVSYVVSYR
jgi:hypothetical protein